MDAGNVAELDSPIVLYDRGGIFRSMCDRSGIRREDFFTVTRRNLATESRFRKREIPTVRHLDG
jgi:ATP-binding cassette subfamily C (CFTR/MRP) protein 1